MSRFGYCPVKMRDHELSDFRSVWDPKTNMHNEKCRHCHKGPRD